MAGGAVLLAVVVSAVPGIPSGVVGALLVAGVAAAVVVVGVVPGVRRRRWRWQVRPEEIDLRHGAFTEVRTIVPMSRVQHVDVRRTLLGRMLETADVVIHTAAGKTVIPALSEPVATQVRDLIADLARAPDAL